MGQWHPSVTFCVTSDVRRIYAFMYRIEFTSRYTTYLWCKSALTKGALLFHLDSSVEVIIIIAD